MPSTIELVARLESQDVTFWLDDGHVWIDGPEDVLTDEVVETLAIHKPYLPAAITMSQQPEAPRPPKPTGKCANHLDRSTWQDHPAPGRPGWIRTTCRVCGRFVGNRPSNTRKQGNKE